MIDIKIIRESPQLVRENIKKKFQNDKLPLVDQILALDSEWRKLKNQVDNLKHERNVISKEISEAKKQNKNVDGFLRKAKQIPIDIENIELKSNQIQEEIKQILYKIPNIIHSSVPIGKDSSENVEIKKIGEIKDYNYEIFNHAELAEKLNGVDFDIARVTSGNGFYYLRGKIAVLSAAMLAYARDYMISKNFEYIEPPVMIRGKVVDGVMSFKDRDAMMYKIEGEDLYLIGTSEHSLIGMFMDKTLNGNKLPLQITGFSPCFRKEVGAHGLEEKGFYRVHQFNKQEMIVICNPEDSYKFYDEMLNYTIEVFRNLNIPVRVLECCSGDLADLKAKSCDVEAYSPRQKKYYEVGSLTNMEEAQARRLNIRANAKGKTYFTHTLNNTVIATPRALIALMENNQLSDGTILVPKVLQKYTNFDKISPQKEEKESEIKETKEEKIKLKEEVLIKENLKKPIIPKSGKILEKETKKKIKPSKKTTRVSIKPSRKA